MLDILLINACVVTQDEKRAVIKKGMVGVEGNRLSFVKPMEAELPASKRVMDCAGKVVMPGLIDGHGHAGHPMTKLVATDSMNFWGRSAQRIYFFFSTPAFWYHDGLISALERLRYGVTTGISVVANEPRADSLEFVREQIRGYREVGVRNIAAVGPGSNNWPKPLAKWDGEKLYRTEATWDEYMANTRTLLETEHLGAGGLTRIAVTPFTIVPSIPTWGRVAPDFTDRLTDFDRKQLKAVKALAAEYKTIIHTDAFGNGIELMSHSDDALLGENVLLQHCYNLSWREVDIVAKTKTNIGHAPEQSFFYCPYTEMLQAGVNVVITSDANGPRVTFDMFEHMRRAQDLEMMRFGDYYAQDAQTLLDGVTIKAAKAVSMQDEIGSLEAGKKADLLLVDKTAPHLAAHSDIIGMCAYAVSGLDVETVICDGRIVMEDRRVPQVDEAAILQRADKIAKETAEAAGVTSFISQKPAFGNPYQTFYEAPLDRTPWET